MAKRPLSELVKTKRSMGELIDAYLWFSKQKNLLKHPPIAKIKYGFLRVTTGLSPESGTKCVRCARAGWVRENG